jgi:hypothetical protein
VKVIAEDDSRVELSGSELTELSSRAPSEASTDSDDLITSWSPELWWSQPRQGLELTSEEMPNLSGSHYLRFCQKCLHGPTDNYLDIRKRYQPQDKSLSQLVRDAVSTQARE